MSPACIYANKDRLERQLAFSLIRLKHMNSMLLCNSMANSEYFTGGEYASQIAEELIWHYAIRGNPYNNILLSTEHPDFTDVHDPDIRVVQESSTLYWPGGDPINGAYFETVTVRDPQHEQSDAELAHEAMTIRTALLTASIGEAALRRVPQETEDAWQAFKDRHPVPILYAREDCSFWQLPLAVCQTGSVAQSALAPEGARIMHLWYPGYVSPKPVLATLRKVVRDLIKDETI